MRELDRRHRQRGDDDAEHRQQVALADAAVQRAALAQDRGRPERQQCGDPDRGMGGDEDLVRGHDGGSVAGCAQAARRPRALAVPAVIGLTC
ncbi:hypothetical protein [Lysobacter koreensis]|uniref:hypothetical protein n=1 Tax=Lysobacter koreensis TaxID=266122 RepID=UPI0036D9DCDA